MATSDAEVTLMDLRAGKPKRLRAVKNGRFVIADAALLEPGPRIGAGLAPGRAPAPPGCVSLSSTPSRSTATAPSSASATRSRSSRRSCANAASDCEPRRSGPGSQPRSPTTGRTRCSGRDPETLAALRLECARIFLEGAGVDLDAASFVDDFMASIVMEPIEGAAETVRSLRARGIEVGVVSNWDIGLTEQLERLGLASLFGVDRDDRRGGRAEARAGRLPARARAARRRAARALHVGDEQGDEDGAAAAGMRFAPAPLATAFDGWS